MNENDPYAKERDALPEKSPGGMALCRDPMIEQLCRVLDVRHPECDQFEPAFRGAVWAVMAETVEQLGRLNEKPLTIPFEELTVETRKAVAGRV